ncbi:MAG TPA: UDP-N-acetylmuramate dehydrogenase [Thermomicrobiaceae bacterium]|nr:UDP-N-acetylmuramate dehydrogenase [Thermomicrobiaceae bacterium]
MLLERNVPLSDVVWYRIGGPARVLLSVRDAPGLEHAIAFVERQRPPRLLVIGRGSNLVLPDGPFDGVVIRLLGGALPPGAQRHGATVEVFGGTLLNDLARSTLDDGLVGLEWAGGLPGTVGAALRGNAGAFGGTIAECVRRVTVVALEAGKSHVLELDHAAMRFGYRDSRLKHERDWIVLRAAFELPPAAEPAVDEARRAYQRHVAQRRRRHPLEYPNCGSVFKNLTEPDEIARVLERWPDLDARVRGEWHGKVPIAAVIERLGLAGLTAGGARLSSRHQNFIVNLGGASAADVRTVIARVRGAVERALGFSPQLEIELVD